MCGIMASIGAGSVNKVFEGLKKLEYRGYDSCGIACKSSDTINVYKSIGYIEGLRSTGVLKEETSEIAIGHTRWATHGGVTIENSHPHTSSSGKFVVVHNGILENYREIKDTVLQGVTFRSDTDTEVVPQLVEKYYEELQDVWLAFCKAIDCLRGSFAIVMMNSIDNTLYFARCKSPMIISKSGFEYTISSDVNGFDNKKYIYHIPDNSIGTIDKNIEVYDNNLHRLKIEWKDYSNISTGIDIEGYPHFMLKEINEIPTSLRSTYQTLLGSKFVLPRHIGHVLIVGCGTSYHSGLMGKKYIESLSGITCECVIASEFIYSDYLVKDNTLAIFISQSGETADTLTAIRRAKDLGIYTLSITNVEGSTITQISDSVVYISVGTEVCVASTKAYTSQVFELLQLSNILLNCNQGNYLADEEGRGSINTVMVDFDRTIDYLNISNSEYEALFNIDIADMLRQVECVVDKINDCRELHLIGKDYDYITSLEGALKIKEVSYIFTDAYPCGELKHGTLSLIEEGSVVISILTREGVLLDKSKNAMHEISARGGGCIAITQFDEKLLGEVIGFISLPNLHSYLMPIVSIVPIDLIAYKVSVMRGINPDKPRNLAKSVTVE